MNKLYLCIMALCLAMAVWQNLTVSALPVRIVTLLTVIVTTFGITYEVFRNHRSHR